MINTQILSHTLYGIGTLLIIQYVLILVSVVVIYMTDPKNTFSISLKQTGKLCIPFFFYYAMIRVFTK